jgi:hypothetical protein
VPECKRRFGVLALPRSVLALPRSLPDHIGGFSAITTIVVLALPDTKSGVGLDRSRAVNPEKNRHHHASMIAIVGRDKLNIEIRGAAEDCYPKPEVPCGRSPPGTLAFVP